MRNGMIRIIIAVLAFILLGYAWLRESHIACSLSDPAQIKRLDGLEFTETSTFDGLMLKNGQLYDIHSLTPENLQEKECAT